MKEIIKRFKLIKYISKRYNIKISKHKDKDGGSFFIYGNGGVYIDVDYHSQYFYEILLHELGHVLDFKVMDKYGRCSHKYNRLYQCSDLRGVLDKNNTSFSEVMKREIIASKNAIRLGKTLGLALDKSYLKWAFNTYQAASLNEHINNKIVISDVDYLATRLLS